MKKYLAEFLGTSIIMVVGTGTIVLAESGYSFFTHPVISFFFGLSVFLAILIISPMGSGHFNPAVSASMWMKKSIAWKDFFLFILLQIAAAIFISAISHYIFPASKSLGTTLPTAGVLNSFLLEMILSGLLMLVILLSIHWKLSLFLSAFVIGLTVGLEAYWGGPFTGASMNPARSIGPALISGMLDHLWVYLLAPVAGMLVVSFSSSYFFDFKGK